jgi:hypothetical protein
MPSHDIAERDYYEAFLNEKRAADFLSSTPKTLQNWRLRGAGPPFTKASGRFVRYRRGDLIEWAAALRVRSTSEFRARTSKHTLPNAAAA